VLAVSAAGLAGAHAAALDLRVVEQPSGWLAPGVPAPVSGWAGPDETVDLSIGSHVVASTTSGPQGGFHLQFATLRPGRYPLSVSSADEQVSAGTLHVRPVRLAAVGDITFGESVGPAVARLGAGYPWTRVARTLRSTDVTTGNLETAVSLRGTPAMKQYVFRGAPGWLRPVHSLAGFDVLTLANNHAVDYGRSALLDSLHAVRAAGMEPIGAGANASRARRPAIVTAGGLRLAFLGYSDINPPGFSATANAPGTARADPATVAADVHAALRRADVAICFFHWGVELHPEPDLRQRQLAAACLNAGASLVLGAHPHVFGPITRPTRHTLVAWTLGNFVFPSAGVTARTGILHVLLGADGVEGHSTTPVQISGFKPYIR
jgi:hypothetical protein